MTSERCSECGHWSSPDPTDETGAGFMAIAPQDPPHERGPLTEDEIQREIADDHTWVSKGARGSIARGELVHLARFLRIVAPGILMVLIAVGAVEALARLGS